MQSANQKTEDWGFVFSCNNCIMLSFSFTAGMQPSPLNYWCVSNSLWAAFWRKNTLQNPIKVYLSFDVDCISRPLYCSHLCNELWVLMLWFLFPLCLFTHFASNADGGIQIFWCIRGHLIHIGLLLLESFPSICSLQDIFPYAIR